MSPLLLQLTGGSPAVYNYSGFSNLIRIAGFNQRQLIEHVGYTNYFLENQHPLVQLLSFMDISPDWDYEYLIEIIRLKYDRWASQLHLTSTYNKGVGYTNTLYYNGFYELLIAAPPSYKLEDYNRIVPSQLTPFIPIYSTDTHIDFMPVSLLEKQSVNKGYKGYAVIAVDLAALAVGYWLHMKECAVLNDYSRFKISHWLCTYPLINFRLLNNRLSVINILFEKEISGKDIEDITLIRKTPMVVNDLRPQLRKYFDFLTKVYGTIPILSGERFIKQIGTWDDRFTDNRTLEGGKYSMYNTTSWVWQLPAMKLYTLIHSYNRRACFEKDFVVPLCSRWALIPVKVWSQFITDTEFKDHYETTHQRLITLL